MTTPSNHETAINLRAALLTAWALSVPSACAHAPACAPGSVAWRRSELFMGSLRRDGAPVDEPAFASFVDRVVTPALPAGFSLLASQGQYRASQGELVREPGHQLIVFHPGDRSTERAIELVRSAYRTAFDQESVLRTDAPTCVSF